MADVYDIAVDFMDMTNARHLWVRPADVRDGFEPVVGRHAVVGDDGGDPKVARIAAIDANRNLELEVLPGVSRPITTCSPKPESAPVLLHFFYTAACDCVVQQMTDWNVTHANIQRSGTA